MQGCPAARIARSPASHPSSLGDAVASISIRKTCKSNVHKHREKVSGKSHRKEITGKTDVSVSPEKKFPSDGGTSFKINIKLIPLRYSLGILMLDIRFIRPELL